jgi:hypothetical protein
MMSLPTDILYTIISYFPPTQSIMLVNKEFYALSYHKPTIERHHYYKLKPSKHHDVIQRLLTAGCYDTRIGLGAGYLAPRVTKFTYTDKQASNLIEAFTTTLVCTYFLFELDRLEYLLKNYKINCYQLVELVGFLPDTHPTFMMTDGGSTVVTIIRLVLDNNGHCRDQFIKDLGEFIVQNKELPSSFGRDEVKVFCDCYKLIFGELYDRGMINAVFPEKLLLTWTKVRRPMIQCLLFDVINQRTLDQGPVKCTALLSFINLEDMYQFISTIGLAPTMSLIMKKIITFSNIRWFIKQLDPDMPASKHNSNIPDLMRKELQIMLIKADLTR